MDNELFSAIVDAARRGVTIYFGNMKGSGDIPLFADGPDDGGESASRLVNTTDPALMTSAIRQLTEQVCR